MFEEPLKRHGVEMRAISKLELAIPDDVRCPEHAGTAVCPVETCNACAQTVAVARLNGKVGIDAEPIDWADVILFRRYYNTRTSCGQGGCEYLPASALSARRHQFETGHEVIVKDDITRAAWDMLKGRDDKALVYETDDNHFQIKPWNGYYGDVVHEQPLIREMTERADLVTVATPALAESYGWYNRRLRVVRNAIDPSLYTADQPRPEGDKPRLLYYGSDVRVFRDYAGQDPNDTDIPQHMKSGLTVGHAYKAVRNVRGLHPVFIGWNGHPAVRQFFTELYPYVESIAGFCRSLANAHGDIGIAPLVGDRFDRCKSELHWLEYSAVGIPTVAQRIDGGPYSPIRHGIDGFTPRGVRHWEEALKALRDSPDLRAEIAGRAKERVLAEYHFEKRAEEWADAFKWASENRGIGLKRTAVAV